MEDSSKQSPELLKIEREYNRDVAMVEATPFFTRILLNIWFGVDVLMILFFVGYLVFFAFVGVPQAKEQAARVANNIETTRTISVARSAQPLGVETARVLSSTDGTYDLYVTVENPNEDWYATFSYAFVTSLGETEMQPGFVMPGESKLIVAFAEEFASRPVSPDVRIEELTWHRVDAGEVDNTALWLGDHLRFAVEEAVHGNTVSLAGDQIPRTSFQLTNNSAFSYWSPTFYVVLGSLTAPSAINTITVPGFEAGEMRQVDVNWFGNVPGSATVEVVPNINFFDDSEYMEVSPGADVDIRDQF